MAYKGCLLGSFGNIGCRHHGGPSGRIPTAGQVRKKSAPESCPTPSWIPASIRCPEWNELMAQSGFGGCHKHRWFPQQRLRTCITSSAFSTSSGTITDSSTGAGILPGFLGFSSSGSRVGTGTGSSSGSNLGGGALTQTQHRRREHRRELYFDSDGLQMT